jgi:hypothetical protein
MNKSCSLARSALTLQVFSHSPELQVVAILFEDAGISHAGISHAGISHAGISGAVLQGASNRDLNHMFNVNGVDLAICIMLKSAVRVWKQCPADAIMRAAASTVRASGGAPARRL